MLVVEQTDDFNCFKCIKAVITILTDHIHLNFIVINSASHIITKLIPKIVD